MPPTPLDEALPALHAHYTAQVNAAVAAGRMDLVRDLADECQDEALALILEAEGASARQLGRSRCSRPAAGVGGESTAGPGGGGTEATNDRVSALDRLAKNP